MKYKFTSRNLHRDVAYFYFGLIIAFSLSGIILNHRQDWYPMDYTVSAESIVIEKNIDAEFFENQEAVKAWAEDLGEDLTYQTFRLREEQLRIYYKENAIADINLSNGEGELEYKRKVPIIGHTMYLHKTTNKSWIWYSDIFGAAMLLIATTGVLIPMGRNGFKTRGWKLALAGVIFPLIFLIFLG